MFTLGCVEYQKFSLVHSRYGCKFLRVFASAPRDSSGTARNFGNELTATHDLGNRSSS